jgi:hypothetical protein
MKKLLLILMTLALAAHAHAMTDAEMKALLVGGGWRTDCGGDAAPVAFRADGTNSSNDEKWDIQDGAYMEIAQERTYYCEILLLTKTEFFAQQPNRGHTYLFWYRKPEDVPDPLWWPKPKDRHD